MDPSTRAMLEAQLAAYAEREHITIDEAIARLTWTDKSHPATKPRPLNRT